MPDATKSQSDILQRFIDSSMNFVLNVSKSMVEVSGKDPDAELIAANAELVSTTLRNLLNSVRTSYDGANALAKRSVEQALEIAGIDLVPITGERAALNVLKKGIFGGGFFSWISKHLAEIKKIIRMILGMILGSVPEWVDKILDLIDQLWNMISELLGGIFGFNRSEIARDISMGEVNFLNELAAVENLQAATARRRKVDDE
jgi:hypothetical protein